MAQIARKLPSEAKPRMVNCDMGHSLFMDKGRIKLFCGSSENFDFLGRAAARKSCFRGYCPEKWILQNNESNIKINKSLFKKSCENF